MRRLYSSILKLYCVILFTIIVTSLTIQPAFGSKKNNKNLSEVLNNRINSTDIHTVLLRNATWEMTLPVLLLGSDRKLELIFDVLSGESPAYTYTLIHCDADWRKSDLEPQEYLTGMGEGNLEDPEPSRNTTIGYQHYSLLFPNEECMPVISGNYVLVVFDTDKPDDPVIIRRFLVMENLVEPLVRISQAPAGDFRETGQQVAVTIDYSNIRLRDAGNELMTVVRQNGRDDNRIVLQPSFMAPGQIEYKQSDGGIFMAGNEYRTLDIRNMRYQTENVAEIAYRNNAYQVTLKPDEERAYKPYFNKTDFDGNFVIDLEKSDHKHLEADYVNVRFILSQTFPFEEHGICIRRSYRLAPG